MHLSIASYGMELCKQTSSLPLKIKNTVTKNQLIFLHHTKLVSIKAFNIMKEYEKKLFVLA